MAQIYQIKNNLNGKLYVGKTLKTAQERFKEHCNDYLKRGAEKRPLYAAFAKYGIENFSLSILEECDDELASEREKFWIEQLGSFKYGYNATLGGDGKPYKDYQWIANTYKEVQGLKETAMLCNCDIETVHKALKRYNIFPKTFQEISREKFGNPIVMIDPLTNEIIKSFATMMDGARYCIDNKLSRSSNLHGIQTHIGEVVSGKRKIAYGYSWRKI